MFSGGEDHCVRIWDMRLENKLIIWIE
jgi:hypothetical protein